MFIYICQTPPHFQFTKKLNNWNSEKVYLVVCGCLLVVCSRLSGGLWLFARSFWSFAGGLCSFVLVCSGLWSLSVLVTTIHTSKLCHIELN